MMRNQKLVAASLHVMEPLAQTQPIIGGRNKYKKART